MTCHLGHRHWGRAGAAGLLLVKQHAGEEHYLLQHRSHLVPYGGTWSIPGGALRHGETPHDGAVREAREELGELGRITHLTHWADDHGAWTYTTVIALGTEVPDRPSPSWEVGASGHRWVPSSQVLDYPLHPDFLASWIDVRRAAVRALMGWGCPSARPFSLVPRSPSDFTHSEISHRRSPVDDDDR